MKYLKELKDKFIVWWDNKDLTVQLTALLIAIIFFYLLIYGIKIF